jgi:hypothetical protein
MLDLYDELTAIVGELDKSKTPYALCGGLAMAIYGVQRNTVDIDLLIRPEHLETVKKAGRKLGYVFEAIPMSFAGGGMEIRRISKVDKASGDALMLDLLLVTSASEDVWQSREQREWEPGKIWVVSRTGLIKLKSLRSSPQDLVDIGNLKELE